MYQSPTQPGQWPQNPSPANQQPNNQQQQPQQPQQNQPPQQQQPQQWAQQPPQQQQQQQQPPPNGQYQQRPPSQQQQPIGPPPTHPPQQGPVMATLQPNHPDQYRALPSLPPPGQMYAQPYQQAPQMGYPPTQPAPRQRTAIACRYCRRRKIRCSGFDQSDDGRCTNCQRFSQECVFTPVSAQTQAFVPAHTVWRGQNPPANTQLYGAYGQPLPHGGREGYPPQQQQPGQPGQYAPPPQGYQQQQQQPMYGQSPQQGTPMNPDGSRKRGNDEPHTPTLPPPNPAQMGPDGQYRYPDTSGLPDAGPDDKPQFVRNPVRDVGVQVDLITGKDESS
ncbi:unnamed protein product [Zymoseptoria tritici ST99CH_3D1]|nr:unnamed protein product [Zymoseptoria tritici ST99CH_3D1]